MDKGVKRACECSQFARRKKHEEIKFFFPPQRKNMRRDGPSSSDPAPPPHLTSFAFLLSPCSRHYLSNQKHYGSFRKGPATDYYGSFKVEKSKIKVPSCENAATAQQLMSDAVKLGIKVRGCLIVVFDCENSMSSLTLAREKRDRERVTDGIGRRGKEKERERHVKLRRQLRHVGAWQLDAAGDLRDACWHPLVLLLAVRGSQR